MCVCEGVCVCVCLFVYVLGLGVYVFVVCDLRLYIELALLIQRCLKYSITIIRMAMTEC